MRSFNIFFLLSEENITTPVWKNNEMCYPTINENKATEYRVDVSNASPEGKTKLFSFTKDMPYIMDLTFYRNEFEKAGEQIKGYTISKITNID